MKTIKGPAIFLAQFAGDKPPFDTLDHMAAWAAGLGYKGIQIPTWASRLHRCREGGDVQDLLRRTQGDCRQARRSRSPSSARHIIGQLVAVHPAYDTLSDGFAPAKVHGNPKARYDWAVAAPQMVRRGVQEPRTQRARAPFRARSPGPILYPFPQRPPVWSKKPSMSWPGAGRRSSTSSTGRASTSATRSTRAKTCTTA